MAFKKYSCTEPICLIKEIKENVHRNVNKTLRTILVMEYFKNKKKNEN